MNWEEALQQLAEAPPLDFEERAKLVSTIHEHIATLTFKAPAPPHAIKQAVANAQAPKRDRKNTRDALVWARGTSFSIRPLAGEMTWWDGVREEVVEKLRTGQGPLALRLSTIEADDDVQKQLLGLSGGHAVRMRIGLDEGSSPHPERDILIEDIVARSIGGADGRQALVVFGFRGSMRLDTEDAIIEEAP